jgi:phage terminase large subunit
MRAQAVQERRRRRQAELPAAPAPRYTFRGAALEFQAQAAPEIVLTGPSETGKTIAVLNRLHQVARAQPIQAVILRKFHVDLHKSVLRTFEKKIIEPRDRVRVYGGSKAEWYDYPSGARIYVSGLDRSSAALSAEYDLVFVNQAEELDVEDWETMTTRATGRAGNFASPAIWGDCNPRGAKHWILERERAGKLVLLKSFHRDNPALYDEAGQPTAQGRRTMATLEALTGVRRKRLYEGEWVTPEGTVYDTFDRAVHVRRREAQEFQYWLLALDEGYTNPAVVLLVGVDADLRLHIAREFYRAGVLPTQHANLALKWARESGAGAAVCDPSATGLIAELRNAGLKVELPAARDVRRGIGLVHELLAVQKDGRPRLTVDPGCVNTINEFESYVYRKGTEDPVKENDHTMDAGRYLVTWLFADEMELERVGTDTVRIDNRW